MIVVHHLENSRSQRVLWLLEELGLDYDVKRYQRDQKTMLAPPELRQVHPLGRSPVIVDEQQGRTIAETGAIIEYLVAQAGGALAPPPDTDQALRYTYWLHYAEGSLMPLLVMRLIFSRLGAAPMPLPLRPFGALIGLGVQRQFLDPRIAANLAFLEAELDGSEWFAGAQLSAADIMLSFPLEAAAARGLFGDNRGYPGLTAFVERIQARAAYQRALERGGPYQLLS